VLVLLLFELLLPRFAVDGDEAVAAVGVVVLRGLLELRAFGEVDRVRPRERDRARCPTPLPTFGVDTDADAAAAAAAAAAVDDCDEVESTLPRRPGRGDD
jgi:hypothetical protein